MNFDIDFKVKLKERSIKPRVNDKEIEYVKKRIDCADYSFPKQPKLFVMFIKNHQTVLKMQSSFDHYWKEKKFMNG